MARGATSTKSKPAEKPASKSGRNKAAAKPAKKGKGDDVSDLESEIEADLAKEFDFEAKDEKKDPPGKRLLGKTVKFKNKGKTIEGKVVEPTSDGDESMVVVEDADAFWDVSIEELTVLDGDEKPKADDISAEFGDLADSAPPPPADEPKKDAEPDVKSEEAKSDEKPAKKGAKVEPPPAETKGEKAEAKVDDGKRRMLPLDSIKMPKRKLRDVDTESPKFKMMLADMKDPKVGQRNAIVVESFKNPVLIDGGYRLKVAETLGWTEIEAQEHVKGGVAKMSDDERLWRSVIDNETREADHWTDLARAFVVLTKNGAVTARQISRTLGISESVISRMIAAVSKKGLLPEVLDIADKQRTEGKYSETVFLEMVGTEEGVQEKALEALKEGKPLTVQDVRNIRRAVKKGPVETSDAGDGEADGGEPSGEAGGDGDGNGKTDRKEWGGTYKALSRDQIGDYLRIVVHSDHVEIRAHIDWEKKTFRNFDPVGEIKDLFDTVYQGDPEKDEGAATINSLEELQKAMTQVKSELST